MISSEPSKVNLLYSIEGKQYNWYVNTKTENEEKYKPIENFIKNENQEQLKEYTIKNGEETSVETLQGEKISISKFDEVLINPEIENDKVDFSTYLTEKEIKETIEKIVLYESGAVAYSWYPYKDNALTDGDIGSFILK